MTSQTRKNKNNGQSAQKRTCTLIKKVDPAMKVLAPTQPFTGGAQIRPKCMGLPGEDIEMLNTARQRLPCSVEVKHGRGWAKVSEAFKQAEANAPPGILPVVVIWTLGSKKPMMLLDAEVGFRFISRGSDDSKKTS